MFPVNAETTVSASEQAHLPSNMFSIPQAEQCTAQLRKHPPTEKMAEPWNQATVRMCTADPRPQARGTVGREGEDAPVKLHFTVAGKQSYAFPFFCLLLFFSHPPFPPSELPG